MGDDPLEEGAASRSRRMRKGRSTREGLPLVVDQPLIRAAAHDRDVGRCKSKEEEAHHTLR